MSNSSTQPSRSAPPSDARSAAFGAILDGLPDPVFLKNTRHQWVYVNRAFAELVGRERAWLIGKSDFDLSPRAEAQVFWQKDDEVLQSGQSNTNLERHTAANGVARVIETKKTLLRIGGKPYLLGVIRDLTVLTEIQGELARGNQELDRRVREQTAEISRSNAQLQNMAFFDALTGLPNRRLLMSSLERRFQSGSLTAASAVAVFYIDLDNFKRANDSHGHAFGDAMLTQLGERLRSLTQFSFVARVGGDEFVAVSREGLLLDKITLAQVCRAILERVSQPFLVESSAPAPRGAVFSTSVPASTDVKGPRELLEASASASVGVAIGPIDAATPDALLQCADNAMFRAKERGRNQYAFFSPIMNQRVRESVMIERGLRRAIRAGEIDVWFQPIVCAKTGQQLGVEALARWQDAELGNVTPDRFVPIAESSGLIHELSHLVLRRALTLASVHLPAPLRLAVNLSALQLDRLTLVEDVRRALDETGFAAQRLELEITESMMANKDERLGAVLNSLRDLGVGLSLDDFGTGYSALAHMQRLPIDRIKIDRSFIFDVAVNPKSRSMVHGMIRMAHALDLRVLAEGIENDAQRAVLCELGCDELQGYLLGRPEPVVALEAN
jgi:diguanylate cyclase (GGDEF)-like protein/PAS domain S-box-containing protein